MIEFTSLSKLASELKEASNRDERLRTATSLSIDDYLETNLSAAAAAAAASTTTVPSQPSGHYMQNNQESTNQTGEIVAGMSHSATHPLKLTDNLNRRFRRGAITSATAAAATAAASLSRAKSLLTRPNSICLTDYSASSFDETTTSSSGCVIDDSGGGRGVGTSSGGHNTSAGSSSSGGLLNPLQRQQQHHDSSSSSSSSSSLQLTPDEHRLKLLESNFNQISIGLFSIIYFLLLKNKGA